jgi:hypothetical protein
MPDYIPPDDAGKLLWVNNFTTWLQANGLTHGFTPGEIGAMNTANSEFTTGMSGNTIAQNAAQASTANKNTKRNTAIDLARNYGGRLQVHPNTSDADRANAGLTIADTVPTEAPPDLILTIPPPLLLLDFGTRGQVTVHWGPNPANERNNGRPAGTLGCQVQHARGGIPPAESGWTALEIDPESPVTHVVNEIAPVTFAYRARYVGKSLKFGPFGDPAVCTVSA